MELALALVFAVAMGAAVCVAFAKILKSKNSPCVFISLLVVNYSISYEFRPFASPYRQRTVPIDDLNLKFSGGF